MATGDNNNLGVRRYDKKFVEMLKAVYEVKDIFADTFGSLQATDGVANTEAAFYIKTSDSPVVINAYDTSDDNTFGDHSDGHSRFGEMREIIYADTAVNYAWTWSIHEGLDRFTVNADLATAEADRIEAQANAKIEKFNDKQAAYLKSVAEIEKTIDDEFDGDDILALFDDLSATYADLGVTGQLIAYAKPQIYNAVVNHPLNNTLKNGEVDIARNRCTYFKGFKVIETPSKYFKASDGDCMYTTVAGMGYAFTGINTVRTIDGQQFDGRELQGAGKAGEYIIPDNRAAVGIVSFT